MLRKKGLMIASVSCALVFIAVNAFASGGISDFSSPLEKVVGTITGDAGKYISIGAMAMCGFVYIFNKDDISGAVKLLLSVVFGISFIAFATNIVTNIFSFSGAII